MKITIDRAVLDQALKALEAATPVKAKDPQMQADAIVALREALAQPQQEPAWWHAVENILDEYGLQAIDFVADFKAALALAQPQQEPVAVYQVKQSIGESVWCDVSKAEFDALVYFGVTKRAVYTSPPAREPLTHGDLDLCRQWFGCIQDTNPSYIGRNDCALAAKLYTRLGLPIPKELQGFSANGIKDTP